MRRRNDAPNGLKDVAQFKLKGGLPLQSEAAFLESWCSRTKRRVLGKGEPFPRDPKRPVHFSIPVRIVEHRNGVIPIRNILEFVADCAFPCRNGCRLGPRCANRKRLGAPGHAHPNDTLRVTQPGDLHDHRVAGRLELFADPRCGLGRSCRGHDQSRTGDPKSGSRGHNCICSFGDEAGDG